MQNRHEQNLEKLQAHLQVVPDIETHPMTFEDYVAEVKRHLSRVRTPGAKKPGYL